MVLRLSLCLALLPLALTGLTGCGSEGAFSVHRVSGAVTLDGQPVEGGSISFLPADGQGATAGGLIANGQYQADVPPGAKKVQIRWQKVVGQHKLYDAPDSPTSDVTEEQIPANYNEQTTLTADIQGDRSDLDFPLTK